MENQERKKVLFVINQLFKGGAEVSLINLLQAIPVDKYEVTLLIFDQIDIKGTISLVDQIPDHVNVVNVAQNEGKVAFVKKAAFKIAKKFGFNQPFRRGVYKYLSGKAYDVAISYGEWFSCALVAKHVVSKQKYVWIHADMEKASFLNPDIVRYQPYFDKFIFASELSMQGAIDKYPFLKNCSYVFHNLVDRNEILRKSKEPIDLAIDTQGLPILLTVANVRHEKNHIRQVKAMKLLLDKGRDFLWLNIGGLADFVVVPKLKDEIQKMGLKKHFLLIGPKENPYPYMKRADAVCVMSDHESWSMVITEAKALRTPVIATKTSGALEQIKDGKTGLLCDFDEKDIADKIETFLGNEELRNTIQKNLKAAAEEKDGTKVIKNLLHPQGEKVLFVFDDINYMSGARNAALNQMELMKKTGANTVLFSVEPCKDIELKDEYRNWDISDNKVFRSLSVPIKQVLLNQEYSVKNKIIRCVYAIAARLHQDDKMYDALLGKQLKPVFEQYDKIYVVSEASKLRYIVAETERPQKIQCVHTDYVTWRELSSWTRAITQNDEKLYQKYDKIQLLACSIKEKFDNKYPSLKEKTEVFPNIIKTDEIISKASEKCNVSVDANVFNIITIGRMEKEKRYDRLLQIAKILSDQGCNFHWFFVGGGKLFENIKKMRIELGLEREVSLTGELENPYPLLKQCQLFVLLSEYEGTPVTIEEAKVLGVPILANDVGGIKEQIGKRGKDTILSDIKIGEVVEIIKTMS